MSEMMTPEALAEMVHYHVDLGEARFRLVFAWTLEGLRRAAAGPEEVDPVVMGDDERRFYVSPLGDSREHAIPCRRCGRETFALDRTCRSCRCESGCRGA